MKVIIKCLPIFLIILVISEKMKTDSISARSSTRKAMPPVEEFGPITKWMSDPLPQVSMRPTLQDTLSEYGDNMESLRVEERVNTLAYYNPNIDFLRSQNCFALNFKWPSEITFPFTTLSLNSGKQVDIQQIRISAPSGCIVVLVGADYLHRMDDIVRMVDHVTAELAIKLVTYFAEKTEVMPSLDLDNSPAIVRSFYAPYLFLLSFCKVLIEKQNNNFGIVFSLFCPANPTAFDQTMIMFQNGSMKENHNFKTICPIKQKEQSMRINYQQGMGAIYIYPETRKLEMDEWIDTSIKRSVLRIGWITKICHHWEIYKLLFIMYNVNPVWIETDIISDYENYDKVNILLKPQRGFYNQ